MPQIIGTVTEDNGSVSTNYAGVVSSTNQTFTFSDKQDGMSFTSKGGSIVTLTINGITNNIPPKGTIRINDEFTSFDVSSSNSQPFEINSFRLKNDPRDVEGFVAQLADRATQITNRTSVSVEDFGAKGDGATDDSVAFQAAINSLTNGGEVVCGIKTYCINNVTLKENVTLKGKGYGRFTTGTTFKYNGTSGGKMLIFGKSTSATSNSGIRLMNFRIFATNTDPLYKQFTGIEVAQIEHGMIKEVTVDGADIGIDVSGRTGAVYLLEIDKPILIRCNKGIYVRSNPYYSNGIYINPHDISSNGIGIHAEIGEGNTIEGKASEIGNNTIAGIQLDGGKWTLKGSSWIENNPIGINVNGGNHIIEGDLYCIDPITVNSGTIINTSRQRFVTPQYKGISKKGLAYWYSFDEGSGSIAYDRLSGQKGSFSTTPTWDSDPVFFRHTVTTQTNNYMNTPKLAVDWTKDWTVFILGYGSNTSKSLYVTDSSNTKNINIRHFKDGLQFFDNASNSFNLYTQPGVNLLNSPHWAVISYDSTNRVLNSYNNSGEIKTTVSYTIDPAFSTPTLVYAGYNGVTLDEFVVYNRLLSRTEIAEIVNIKHLPVFNSMSDNQLILKSPDGSRWKQSIDNAGVVTWTKL